MTVHVIDGPVKAKLTMRGAEKLVGLPVADWEGNCFAVASKLASYFGGVAVYGHWLGEISPKGYWEGRAGQAFCNHGWIVLPNERGKYGVNCETIVDPTRWSFEAKKPYIWRGKNDGTYDEGGNKFRMATRGHEPPEDDGEHDSVLVDLLSEESSEESYTHVAQICKMGRLTNYSAEDPYLSRVDAHWLATTDPAVIGWFIVAEVYEALCKAGCRAMIPIDNWKMVDRRFKLRCEED